MELTRQQWLVAVVAAVSVHLLVLAGAWLAALSTANTPPATPRGVMVSLDSFDAGPPPTAASASPAPAEASAPEQAVSQVPAASTAPAPTPAADVQSAIAPEPAPQIGPDSTSAAQQGDSNAANKQDSRPQTAEAVTIDPIDVSSDITPQERTVARNIAPEPAPTTEVTRDSNGAYGNSNETTQDYIVRLRAWLARHKQYPDSARRDNTQGTVRLYIVVDQDGHILRHRIQQSSGSAVLDQAAEQMLKRSAPLPRMPASMQRNRLELVVPVAFTLQ